MNESLDKKIDNALKPISDSITNFIFDSFSLMVQMFLTLSVGANC